MNTDEYLDMEVLKSKLERAESNNKRYFDALKTISTYQSVEHIRKMSKQDWGLSPNEVIEAAFENVLQTAKYAIRGRRRPV